MRTSLFREYNFQRLITKSVTQIFLTFFNTLEQQYLVPWYFLKKIWPISIFVIYVRKQDPEKSPMILLSNTYCFYLLQTSEIITASKLWAQVNSTSCYNSFSFWLVALWHSVQFCYTKDLQVTINIKILKKSYHLAKKLVWIGIWGS